MRQFSIALLLSLLLTSQSLAQVAAWKDFTDSDYARTSASVSVNNTSTSLRIRAVANRAALQNLLAQGFVQPYEVRLAANGDLQFRNRRQAGTINALTITNLADGELFDLTIEFRALDDQVNVTDHLGNGHGGTHSVDIHDSYSPSGNLFMGRYAANGSPATDIEMRYLEVLHNGVSVHRWDPSISHTVDQVGNRNLTIVGSPTLQESGNVIPMQPLSGNLQTLSGNFQ